MVPARCGPREERQTPFADFSFVAAALRSNGRAQKFQQNPRTSNLPLVNRLGRNAERFHLLTDYITRTSPFREMWVVAMKRTGKPAYPVPFDEPERLSALRAYEVTDTPPESEFDHIVKLAADLFEVPTALISFVESDRQFFKARIGFDACDTARDVSFCAHALVRDDVLVVPDATRDDRFRDNPLVIGAPYIRFYAGAPLATADGHKIGSICVIDNKPRPPLSMREQEWLRGLATLTMDHLERRRLEIFRRAAVNLAAKTPDALLATDGQFRIRFWNRAAEEMFGISGDFAVGRPFASLFTDVSWAVIEQELGRVRSDPAGNGTVVRVEGCREAGRTFMAEISLAAWRDDEEWRFGAIVRDTTQRDDEHRRIRYLTHFDTLTDLPNRARFLERIADELGAGRAFTVLKVGLDRFKEINASFGLAVGDTILRRAGERIVASVGPDAFVARLGSDEFGVLWSGSDDPIRARSVGEYVLAVLSEPFDLDGGSCHVGASIGVVLSPALARFDTAGAVLKGGLLALHEAKRAGGRRMELFRPQFGAEISERRRVEEELHDAFDRGELELFYQPQVRLSDRSIVGAEALIRWRHPARGLLSPASFLPVLEASDLAGRVGEWVIDRACAFAGELMQHGKLLRVGVNIFGTQLRDGRLAKVVTRCLQESALPAHQLELEITETTVLGLDGELIGPLRQLRETGVGIAFDDYGTGYASLSLLKRYPLTRLKIDREFVQDLETNQGDAAIVRAVLAMAASLGLDVIAEGMETEAQAAILQMLGCQEAQGYLFGKPMPGEEFRHTVGICTPAAA